MTLSRDSKESSSWLLRSCPSGGPNGPSVNRPPGRIVRSPPT